jgi:hypothetical protein
VTAAGEYDLGSGVTTGGGVEAPRIEAGARLTGGAGVGAGVSEAGAGPFAVPGTGIAARRGTTPAPVRIGGRGSSGGGVTSSPSVFFM